MIWMKITQSDGPRRLI